MKSQLVLPLLLVLVSLFAAACGAGGLGEAASDTSEGAVADQAGLLETLRDQGAEVELGETIQQEIFSVAGRILKMDGADVQVFEYESVKALQADADQVAPDGGSIGTTMITWVASPHFFRSGRVLVLYVGDDGAVLERLQDVLGEQFAGR